MTLSAPTMPVFAIAVILAILAVVGTFVAIPFVTQYAFWVAVAAFVILAAGCLFRGV